MTGWKYNNNVRDALTSILTESIDTGVVTPELNPKEGHAGFVSLDIKLPAPLDTQFKYVVGYPYGNPDKVSEWQQECGIDTQISTEFLDTVAAEYTEYMQSVLSNVYDEASHGSKILQAEGFYQPTLSLYHDTVTWKTEVDHQDLNEVYIFGYLELTTTTYVREGEEYNQDEDFVDMVELAHEYDYQVPYITHGEIKPKLDKSMLGFEEIEGSREDNPPAVQHVTQCVYEYINY